MDNKTNINCLTFIYTVHHLNSYKTGVFSKWDLASFNKKIRKVLGYEMEVYNHLAYVWKVIDVKNLKKILEIFKCLDCGLCLLYTILFIGKPRFYLFFLV